MAEGSSIRPAKRPGGQFLLTSTSEVYGDPLEHPQRRLPDIGRAREVLGWVPTTSLDSRLKATIVWFLATRPNGNADPVGSMAMAL